MKSGKRRSITLIVMVVVIVLIVVMSPASAQTLNHNSQPLNQKISLVSKDVSTFSDQNLTFVSREYQISRWIGFLIGEVAKRCFLESLNPPIAPIGIEFGFYQPLPETVED